MYNYIQYIPRRFTLVLFDLVDYILVFICSIQSTTKFHQPRHHHFCQYKQISKSRLGKIADSAILTCTSIANFALNMPRKLDFCQLSKNFQNKDQVKLSCHTLGIFSLICYGFSKPYCHLYIYVVHIGKIQKGTKESIQKKIMICSQQMTS